jgi:7-carboxy-7-deazaguanine synthase
VLKIIDIKTPDSGEPGKFSQENLNLSDVNTEFKFVICSEKDFLWAEDFVREHRLNEKYAVLYSPSHGVVSPKWLAEKILQNKSNVRLQLQQHKYIWSSDTRGV